VRDDRRIPMARAGKMLRANPATLKKAADLGYVDGVTKTPAGYYLATPEAWMKGLEAYRRAMAEQRYPSDVPRGWISLAEAARRLGTRQETMLAIARAQLVPVYVRSSGGRKKYYAHPKAWERGLQRWRQGDGAWVRHRMMPRRRWTPRPHVAVSHHWTRTSEWR